MLPTGGRAANFVARAEPIRSGEPVGSANLSRGLRNYWCVPAARRLLYDASMKRSIVLSLLLSTMLLSGCIVHTGPRGHARGRAAASPACHPSEYWDGNRCVHKGNRGRGHHK